MIPRGVSILLAFSLLVFSNQAGSQLAGGRPKSIFTCSFGKKRVQVTAAGSNLLYEFGTPQTPDIVVVGNAKAKNVSHHFELLGHSTSEELRFRNGAYGYVLYHLWASPGYDGKGAEDRSGLQVQQGGKVLANLRCKTSAEFGEGYNLKSLPDADTLIDP